MPTDNELLRQYAEQQDEAAFAELVRRQVDLVYSAAVRMTRNPALAEDVTQKVFAKLAQQAGRLGGYESLVGWLHTAARHGAIDAIRGEERRRAREQEATAMHTTAASEINWEDIGPVLDEAVGSLREDDRQAVLLRYFKNLSHQEVGAILGLSEDTARKRIERALEKLRAHFSRRGVTATAAILTEAISANSVQAAPTGLAEKITPSALASVTVAGTAGGAFLLTLLYMSTKTKIALGIALVVAVATTVSLNWPMASTPATAAASSAVVAAKPAAASPAASMAPPQVEVPKAMAVAASARTVAATGAPVAALATAKLTPAQINASFNKLVTGFVQIYTTLIGSHNATEALQQIQEMEPQIQTFAAGVKDTPLEQPLAEGMDTLTAAKEALLRGDLLAAQNYMEKANQAGVLLQGAVQRLVAGAPPAEVAPPDKPDPAELAAMFVQIKQHLNDLVIAIQNNNISLAMENITALEPALQVYTQKIQGTPGHDNVATMMPVVASLKISLQKGNLAEAKQIVVTFLNTQQKQAGGTWPL